MMSSTNRSVSPLMKRTVGVIPLLQKNIGNEKDFPLAGMEYALESKSSFGCNLCRNLFKEPSQMLMHMIGWRHKTKYEKTFI